MHPAGEFSLKINLSCFVEHLICEALVCDSESSAMLTVIRVPVTCDRDGVASAYGVPDEAGMADFSTEQV